MARSYVSILAAILLILTLGASRSASQEGFQSINCGGEAYNDPNTRLIWDADPFNENDNVLIYGQVGQVNSDTDVMSLMTTLRFFPNDSWNRKFCYPLGKVSVWSTYLLRASFLYGNYDGRNQPPAFVLILNSGTWTNVSTSSSNIPIIHELIFVSNENYLNVCLAPKFNSNDIPFISTLELRLLENTTYNHPDGAIFQGYGLMLSRRINYGAILEAEVRHPEDRFDRIWEANTTGPSVSTSRDMVGSDYKLDQEKPPTEVMATAITSSNSKGNLSFTYDGFGGLGGFLVQMHFQEVDEKARGQSLRNISFEIAGVILPFGIEPGFGGPIGVYMDAHAEWPLPLQLTLFPTAGSPNGPLLNAIELFAWTPEPLPTSFATFQEDVIVIQQVQEHFNLTGYGYADPCLPKGYSWTWIECSNDLGPTITKINLASFNLIGQIPPFINKLTSLKSIDLSNNMLVGEIPDVHFSNLEYLDLHNNNLTGELPPSLLSLEKLKKLDVSYNNLCGTFPSFSPSTNYTTSSLHGLQPFPSTLTFIQACLVMYSLAFFRDSSPFWVNFHLHQTSSLQ